MNKYYPFFLPSIVLLMITPIISYGQENVDSVSPDHKLAEDSGEILNGTKKLEEPVMVSLSNLKNRLILDGKWSDDVEWKSSGYSGWLFDDGSGVILRSAHQDNDIYFLVDFISDRTIDKNMDHAIICLEGNNKKNLVADDNTYCFISSVYGNNPTILQGGGVSSISGNFNKIFNENVIVRGTASDYKDRYSQISHTSYEFKIPTDLVGRYNEYGLYVAVYDYSTNKLYSWPRNIESENSFTIPSPEEWGVMISPDKSLPEFEFPFLLFIMSFMMIIYFSSTKLSQVSFKFN